MWLVGRLWPRWRKLGEVAERPFVRLKAGGVLVGQASGVHVLACVLLQPLRVDLAVCRWSQGARGLQEPGDR